MPYDYAINSIKARKIEFNLKTSAANYWCYNSLIVTSFVNALSSVIPAGEKFFIRSVKHYRNDISDPQLLEQIKGFMSQEAAHSQWHDQWNAAVRHNNKHQLYTEKIGEIALKLAGNLLPARSRLAITCALEHFTAMASDTILRQREQIEYNESSFVSLLLWHAVEETEHKAVCFDVHQAVTGKLSGYLERSLFMFITTIVFSAITVINVILLISGDRTDRSKKSSTQSNRGAANFMFDRKSGFVWPIIKSYFQYYHPGFHPWNHDNSDLLIDTDA